LTNGHNIGVVLALRYLAAGKDESNEDGFPIVREVDVSDDWCFRVPYKLLMFKVRHGLRGDRVSVEIYGMGRKTW
jgi:hypothetical protein